MSTETPVEQNDHENTCCGVVIKTKFCPHCGHKVTPIGSMSDLLLHLDKQARVHEESARRWQERVEADSNDKWARRNLSGSERLASKWRRWHGELVRLMSQDTSDSQASRTNQGEDHE